MHREVNEGPIEMGEREGDLADRVGEGRKEALQATNATHQAPDFPPNFQKKCCHHLPLTACAAVITGFFLIKSS